MDWSFTEEQDELAALARRVLEDRVTHESLTDLEASDAERFDRALWAELGQLELLGIALPDDLGGSGYGLIEQCLVLREVGRTLAPVPVLAAVVTGALPIATFGTQAQRDRWVPPVVAGDAVLTAALAEPANREPLRPSTTAVRDGKGYRLTGVKTSVPAGTIADAILVPATVRGGGARVFLVEPDAGGVTITPQLTTSRDTHGYVEFDGVVVDEEAALGDDTVLAWMLDRATVGLCALQLGVCERGLEHTAEYTKQRVQFERPIATFQAVGHRCADAYIDVEGIRLTLWQAAWRLAEGLPAREEVETAKFWAAEGGHRVAHAVVHLHGGMGVATEYFVHRYFVHAKQIEFMLGGATEQALRIGDALAAEPA
jgi:3-oxocholest-4-en-26-oyl-CoA dehydrogenase beta subunit